MSNFNIELYLAFCSEKGFKENTQTSIKRALRIFHDYCMENNINKLEQVTVNVLTSLCAYVNECFKSYLTIFSHLKYYFIWLFNEGFYSDDVSNVFSIRSKVTLRREFVIYKEAMQDAMYAKSTIMHKESVLKILESFLNKKNITDLSCMPKTFKKDFIIYLNVKKYSPKYIGLIFKESKAIFNYLKSKNHIAGNPFSKTVKFGMDYYPVVFKKEALNYLRVKQDEGITGNSIRGIKNSFNVFFKYLTKNSVKTFNQINRDILKGFIGYLIDLKKKNGHSLYKVCSINRMLANIRSFLRYESERGKVYYGLVSFLSPLKSVKNIHRNILTRKELFELFNIEVNSIYEFMFKCLFVCQYATGLRIGELLDLKKADIDFTKKTLLIYESKTRKERYVHIAEVGLRYLSVYLKYARSKINNAAEKMEKVFVSNYEGLGLREGIANKYLKRFCKRAGIKKHISTHCFRHSYGTHLLENGAEIKHVSELLGHEKLSTTEYYTRLSPERLKEVIKKYHPREV